MRKVPFEARGPGGKCRLGWSALPLLRPACASDPGNRLPHGDKGARVERPQRLSHPSAPVCGPLNSKFLSPMARESRPLSLSTHAPLGKPRRTWQALWAGWAWGGWGVLLHTVAGGVLLYQIPAGQWFSSCAPWRLLKSWPKQSGPERGSLRLTSPRSPSGFAQ